MKERKRAESTKKLKSMKEKFRKKEREKEKKNDYS